MGLSVIRSQFLVFAVKSANFLMFTVSGENTVKCLKGFRGFVVFVFSSAQTTSEL